MSLIRFQINEEKVSSVFKLHNINFAIEPNTICSFIGNNGAGKSSLLNLLIKNNKTKKNSIFINEQDIHQISYKDLALKIAFVPQIASIYNELSVYDYVAMGRLPHTNFLGILKQTDYQIINQTLDKLQITKFKNVTIGSLSGGERQKVIIANALVQQTPIIVLDEPLSYLDLKAKDDICEIVLNLKNYDHKTIVMVVHEVDVAANLSDQVALFYQGTTPIVGKSIDVVTANNLKQYFGVDRQVHLVNNKIKIEN